MVFTFGLKECGRNNEVVLYKRGGRKAGGSTVLDAPFEEHPAAISGTWVATHQSNLY